MFVSNLMTRQALRRAAALAAISAVAAGAQAAVPTEAQAIFTEAATDFGVIAGYGFTAMAAIVGGLIVFKIVKKVANKAT